MTPSDAEAARRAADPEQQKKQAAFAIRETIAALNDFIGRATALGLRVEIMSGEVRFLPESDGNPKYDVRVWQENDY